MVGERVTLAAQALVVRLIFPEPANHPAVHPAARKRLVKRLFFIALNTLKDGSNFVRRETINQLYRNLDEFCRWAIWVLFWDVGFYLFCKKLSQVRANGQNGLFWFGLGSTENYKVGSQ